MIKNCEIRFCTSVPLRNVIGTHVISIVSLMCIQLVPAQEQETEERKYYYLPPLQWLQHGGKGVSMLEAGAKTE